MKKVINIIDFIDEYIWCPIVAGFTSVYENTKYVAAYTSIIFLLVSVVIKILKNIGI